MGVLSANCLLELPVNRINQRVIKSGARGQQSSNWSETIWRLPVLKMRYLQSVTQHKCPALSLLQSFFMFYLGIMMYDV